MEFQEYLLLTELPGYTLRDLDRLPAYKVRRYLDIITELNREAQGNTGSGGRLDRKLQSKVR